MGRTQSCCRPKCSAATPSTQFHTWTTVLKMTRCRMMPATKSFTDSVQAEAISRSADDLQSCGRRLSKLYSVNSAVIFRLVSSCDTDQSTVFAYLLSLLGPEPHRGIVQRCRSPSPTAKVINLACKRVRSNKLIEETSRPSLYLFDSILD